MAYESKEELGYKIEKLEKHIEKLKAAEYPDEGEIYRLELEVSKFKNMKGDEGLNTQREVPVPENVTMSGIPDQDLLEKNPEYQARKNDPVDPDAAKELAAREAQENKTPAAPAAEKQTRANPTVTTDTKADKTADKS